MFLFSRFSVGIINWIIFVSVCFKLFFLEGEIGLFIVGCGMLLICFSLKVGCGVVYVLFEYLYVFVYCL